MAELYNQNITFDASGIGTADDLSTAKTGAVAIATTVDGVALNALNVTATALNLTNSTVELVDGSGDPLTSPINTATNFAIKITLKDNTPETILTSCDYTIKVNDGSSDLVDAEVDFTAGIGTTSTMLINTAGSYTLTASIKDSTDTYNAFITTIALTVDEAPDAAQSSVELSDGGTTLLTGYPFDVTITIKDSSGTAISGEKSVEIND